jgi:hypothetical protein
MFRTGIALFAVVVFAALPAAARTQVKKSDAVVKITATAGKIENDKQTVEITITIEKPWHIYANPVGLEDIASAATELTITGKVKPTSVKVDYPPGKVEMDSTVGNYKIYEDKVVIKAEVQRAKGDTEPLKASIKLQACSIDKEKKGGKCLFPATIEVDVK